jgi:hypothetical protein
MTTTLVKITIEDPLPTETLDEDGPNEVENTTPGVMFYGKQYLAGDEIVYADEPLGRQEELDYAWAHVDDAAPEGEEELNQMPSDFYDVTESTP